MRERLPGSQRFAYVVPGDGEDFAALPAASHQPAALWEAVQLLGSVLVVLWISIAADYTRGH